jgi:putative tryptophan/tyrosine transport system substrate-binding protein
MTPISILGSAVVAALILLWAPPTGHTQPATKVARVGVLAFGTPETDPNLSSLREGLRDLGYAEGRNLAFEYRYAGGQTDRLPGLALELVHLKPDVIFALGGDVAPAARTATTTIPIVVSVSNDPVRSGLVASFARPGGNITGVTFISSDLAAKRLQLLKEIAPKVTRVGVLWNPDHIDPEHRETQAAGRALDVQIHSLEVRGPADFEEAFRAAAAARLEAIVVVSSRLTTLNRYRIVEHAARTHTLLVTGWGPWADSGALVSYGPDINLAVRHAATYVDRILKGARPADLPIQLPTNFELVVNLKTARAYGLSIPSSVRARADKIIE